LAIFRNSEQSLKFQGSGILPEDLLLKISKDSKAKCARVLFYIFSKSAIARFPSRGISCAGLLNTSSNGLNLIIYLVFSYLAMPFLS
jgi:hypothetical protein